MSPTEVLAIARLRQWGSERTALKAGRIANYRNPGRPQAKNPTNRFDAAIVRVIDFERAIAGLTTEQQIALILTYRDKQGQHQVAAAVGCSVRKLDYLIPAARKELADRLDRLELL
jgi:DNA-directed RNA polymerase specialized sigma24 family protein